MLVSSVIVLLTIGSTSISATNYARFNLLKDDRAAGRLVFIPTTLAQREVILSNVKNTLTIQAGDELLAINGLSFVEWFKQNQFTSGAGANDFGGQRAALKYLTTIYGKANRLPSDDSIKFQFKSRANPHTSYTVNVPYVSGHDEDCWNLGSKLYKSITSKTLPGTPETSLPVSAKQSGDNQESNTAHLSPKGRKMDNPKDSKREIAMGKISSSRQGSAILMSPTGVTKVTWGIYQPESTNMGIIKLNSFDPEDVGTTNLAVLKSVMVIRSLLVNELKDTKSVMFDLRGNSGGDTEFANNMVQLFKPDFQPFGHRYLMNKITFNLFVDGEDPNADIYAKAWKETEPNSRFTKVFFLNSVESVNTIGQAYVRPMGIFNDGRCYSSCEIFSGSIQGHGAGTIFGEDKQTGGGGATVMELDPFLSLLPLTTFRSSHSARSLPVVLQHYANTLSVGVIQAVRTGLYNGQDIEDAGITQILFSVPGGLICSPTPLPTPSMIVLPESLARTGQEEWSESALLGYFEGNLDFCWTLPILNYRACGWLEQLEGAVDDWQRYQVCKDVSILPLRLSSLLPVGTKVNLVSMSLSTLSPDMDFLYLSVKSSGGVEDFLLQL
ncbi:hypothetical protein BASA81_010634 [Batrachochytrium salamandrivorans]|nr:hypothetical protein BASA81_010634 [Batrachochytrium salamandrivorans]